MGLLKFKDGHIRHRPGKVSSPSSRTAVRSAHRTLKCKAPLCVGVVRAVGPAAQQMPSQMRGPAPACPPPWAPLGRDGVSFPTRLCFVGAFIGAGCLLDSGGLRHGQHLLLLQGCCWVWCVRRGFFYCYLHRPGEPKGLIYVS